MSDKANRSENWAVRAEKELRGRPLSDLTWNTPEGIAVFNRVWPRAQSKIAQITDRFEPEEFVEFKRLLGKLHDVAMPMLNDLPTENTEKREVDHSSA